MEMKGNEKKKGSKRRPCEWDLVHKLQQQGLVWTKEEEGRMMLIYLEMPLGMIRGINPDYCLKNQREENYSLWTPNKKINQSSLSALWTPTVIGPSSKMRGKPPRSFKNTEKENIKRETSKNKGCVCSGQRGWDVPGKRNPRGYSSLPLELEACLTFQD